MTLAKLQCLEQVSFYTASLTWIKLTIWSQIDNLHFNGLVQDCINSIANALGLLRSCTEPSIWVYSTTGAYVIPNTTRTHPPPVSEMVYTIWAHCITDMVPSFVRWQSRKMDCDNMQYGGTHVVAKPSWSVLYVHGPESWFVLFIDDIKHLFLAKLCTNRSMVLSKPEM